MQRHVFTPLDKPDRSNLLPRGFRPVDIKIDHDRLLSTANQHTNERLVGSGIDLLVRDVRQHDDKIARAGLRDKFQALAPAHARAPAHDIDHAFQLAVMVCPGLRLRMDLNVPAQSLLAPARA